MHCNNQKVIEALKSKSICILPLIIPDSLQVWYRSKPFLARFSVVQAKTSTELTQSGEAWRLLRIGVRAQLHSIAQEYVESSCWAHECYF